MKISLSKRNRAMTLIELFVIVAVLALLAALLLPALVGAKARAIRMSCVNNLKVTGLAFRIWAGDNGDKYPMEVSGTTNGTMEFITGTNAFRHFQVMSNELSTPMVVTCPSEQDYFKRATNWTDFNNSNISFFVGIDANETNSQMILSGDHNLTNGTTVKNGLLDLDTNHSSDWTAEMHNKVGNVLLSDMSVQQVDTRGLRKLVANTGLATNRLQMP
jgi:type II secretory pathway pseudopilin PulG